MIIKLNYISVISKPLLILYNTVSDCIAQLGRYDVKNLHLPTESVNFGENEWKCYWGQIVIV